MEKIITNQGISKEESDWMEKELKETQDKILLLNNQINSHLLQLKDLQNQETEVNQKNLENVNVLSQKYSQIKPLYEEWSKNNNGQIFSLLEEINGSTQKILGELSLKIFQIEKEESNLRAQLNLKNQEHWNLNEEVEQERLIIEQKRVEYNWLKEKMD